MSPRKPFLQSISVPFKGGLQLVSYLPEPFLVRHWVSVQRLPASRNAADQHTGPLIAGLITEYTTWRVILYLQSGMIALSLGLSVLFLGRGGKAATVHHPSVRDILQEYNPIKVVTFMRYPNLLFTVN